MVVFVDYSLDTAYLRESNGLRHQGIPPLNVEPTLKMRLPADRLGPPTSNLTADSKTLSTQREAQAGTPTEDSELPEAGSKENGEAEGLTDINITISTALSCYPVVIEIARAVDLTTLHALSMTCRQVHAALSLFRHQLVRETLRCQNESIDRLFSGSGSHLSDDDLVDSGSQPVPYSYLSRKLKVPLCARDMVGKCQRCSDIVCRNCTMKPPNAKLLKERLRRLCATCLSALLVEHGTTYPAKYDAGTQSITSLSQSDLHICSCDSKYWYCRPCGQHLRCEDVTYHRVWSWRSKYSTYLGGGGHWVGFGDGTQGVQCGRGEKCLGAEYIEVEVDCEVEDWTSDHSDHTHSNHSHDNLSDQRFSDGRDDEEPGYLRQEIVGIGGVVKHKVKKRVKVGANVMEHDDERESATYLKEETSGSVRSCCGWCSLIVPSNVERNNTTS